eukprot:724643-Pyramimonas_sp.AAC.1
MWACAVRTAGGRASTAPPKRPPPWPTLRGAAQCLPRAGRWPRGSDLRRGAPGSGPRRPTRYSTS